MWCYLFLLEFYADFIDSSSKGTKLVSSTAFDSGIPETGGCLAKSTIATVKPNNVKIKKSLDLTKGLRLALIL